MHASENISNLTAAGSFARFSTLLFRPIRRSQVALEGMPLHRLTGAGVSFLMACSFASFASATTNFADHQFTRTSSYVQQLQSTVARINDTATSMCATYQGMVEQIVRLRQGGTPVSVAKSMIESSYRLDPRLWSVLNTSVDVAYAYPTQMTDALRTGLWLEACASHVRGS